MPELINAVTPKNNGDFSMMEDIHMQGSMRVVGNLAARDAITNARRKDGMMCWVVSESKYYALRGGIDNLDWVELDIENPPVLANEPDYFLDFGTTDRYVSDATGDDTNDGSIGSPWKTAQKAFTDIELRGQGFDSEIYIHVLDDPSDARLDFDIQSSTYASIYLVGKMDLIEAGVATPGGSSLLADQLNHLERSKIQGTNDLLVGLATALGSFISGLIFAAMGYGMVGIIGALLALIPLGMTLRWQLGQRKLASTGG